MKDKQLPAWAAVVIAAIGAGGGGLGGAHYGAALAADVDKIETQCTQTAVTVAVHEAKLTQTEGDIKEIKADLKEVSADIKALLIRLGVKP